MKNKGKLKFLTTIAGIDAICASTFAIAYEFVKNSISYSSLDNSSSNEFNVSVKTNGCCKFWIKNTLGK